MFKVLKAFTTGELTSSKGKVIEIKDKKVSDMLLKAGIIAKYDKSDASSDDLQKQITQLESEKEKLESELAVFKEIKVQVPDGATVTTLGEKTVEEFQENVTISPENSIQGSLKHLASFEEFGKDAKGNFLALYFPEAKADKVITCEVKGDGSKLKKPVAVDQKDGLIVLQIANKNQTIEVVSDGMTTKTLTLTELDLKTE